MTHYQSSKRTRLVVLLGLGLFNLTAGCKPQSDITLEGTVTVAQGQAATNRVHSRRLMHALMDKLFDLLVAPAFAYTHIGLGGSNVAVCFREDSGQLQLAEPAISLDTIAVTDSQGNYQGLKVSGPAYEQRSKGLFICASNPSGTITQIAGPIPPSFLEEGGRIEINASPAETIITKLMCGAPRGWRVDCREGLPQTLHNLIEATFDKTQQPDARNLAPSFNVLRNDPTIRQTLEPVLQSKGISWDDAFNSAPSSLQAPNVPSPPPPSTNTGSQGGPNRCTPSFCQLCRTAGNCSDCPCP